MFLWMLSVSLTFRKLFVRLLYTAAASMNVEYLLSNASYVICFGSLHLVVFKEKCFPQCCAYFFYFNVFKQVNFVEFIHLPKFLISAIQARGFVCRARIWEGEAWRQEAVLSQLLVTSALLPFIFVRTIKQLETRFISNWLDCGS